MRLLKPLVFVSTVLCANIVLAQPPEPAKEKPESASQAILRMRAEGRARAKVELRKTMGKYGVSENDQDAVILIIGNEDAQRDLIRQAYYQLTIAEDAGVADDQYTLFLQDFEKACEQHRTQRAQDSKTIADKLQLTQKPRLQGYLTLQGIIGDEVSFLTPVSEVAYNTFSRKLEIEREVKQPRRVAIPDDKPNA